MVGAISRNKTYKKKKPGNTWQENLFIITCLLVPVVYFLIFYVYVNFDAFLMAFQKPVGGKIEWTLDNFTWVWERITKGSTLDTDNLQVAFQNTFITFGIQIALFFVGLVVSYAIYKQVLGYKVFRVLLYLPAIISGVVTSFFYIELMNASWLQEMLTNLFHLDYQIKSPLMDPDFANWMVLLNFIWLGIPSNLILWGGAFSRIPTAVLESARIDGCNWVRELFQIILPIIWPTFVMLITTNLAGIFGCTGAVFLLTGGQYGTQTVSNWMYMKVQLANNSNDLALYRASALGFVLTLISCAIALFVRFFLNKHVQEVEF